MQIRQAKKEDLQRIAEIERRCFPAAEAALPEEFAERFAVFGENFYVAEEDGQVIGFVNGGVTDEPKLPDAFYHDASLHRANGAYQTVFGLDVLPEYRRRGIGAALLLHLIEQSAECKRKGVVLTCKDERIHFYEKAGFTCMGASESVHGGAKWNDMLLCFAGKE